MGITRSRLHKKRVTGGKRHVHRKKRRFEMGRPPAMTKLVIGERRVRPVRTRGGNQKWRALRLDAGNYSWGSEGIARKARILDVVYNASNNELVRTKTIVKGCIVQVDATPFRNWYYKWYGVQLGEMKEHIKNFRKPAAIAAKEKKAGSSTDSYVPKTRLKNWRARSKQRTLEAGLEAEFNSSTGRLLARVASSPGQVGRADGYILEGKELEFYKKMLDKKKKKGK
eukprot:NODE_4438_length_807_cov_596.246702_g4104_i0.p2 GENE.NODE_4438_length_807_cov_596.246702_g4104_i0~~NODE_4438_length_807_cov_596.246702_g4104_i0.p2  ORF type:complete len:226 (+),score=44.31 NODE_4438_length_807_cov_596.246702_g4104_i0:69-746(+)